MATLLRRFFNRKPKKKPQTTFCYCPQCNNELVSSNSFVHDDGCVVDYNCSKCGHHSAWWFNTPVPILLESPNILIK